MRTGAATLPILLSLVLLSVGCDDILSPRPSVTRRPHRVGSRYRHPAALRSDGVRRRLRTRLDLPGPHLLAR